MHSLTTRARHFPFPSIELMLPEVLKHPGPRGRCGWAWWRAAGPALPGFRAGCDYGNHDLLVWGRDDRTRDRSDPRPPVDPILYEPSVRDARTYVRIAQEQTGPIGAPVAFDYIWGEALEVLKRFGPDVRLINLETSVTTSNDYWEGERIHYRMHPANIRCLTSAGIDCCVLANNHVLDWGARGCWRRSGRWKDAASRRRVPGTTPSERRRRSH